MGFGVYFVDQLKVIAYAYFCGARPRQQTVIVAFAPAYAVAVAVIGHGRHYNHLYVVYVFYVASDRLFDVKCSILQP